MKITLSRGLGIVAACVACLISACGDDGAAEVRAVYDEYNTALRRRDGDAFIKVVDPENVKHYDQYVQIARRGSRAQIAQLHAMGRSYVLMIRHRLKGDELARLDGAGFVKICVERDWFFKEDEGEKFTLGSISMKPPRASAELLVNRQRSGERWEFVKVDGRWFVNDEGLDRMHNKDIAEVARRLRVSEDRVLFESEAEQTGEDVDPRIFDNPPEVSRPPPPEAGVISLDPKPAKKATKKR